MAKLADKYILELSGVIGKDHTLEHYRTTCGYTMAEMAREMGLCLRHYQLLEYGRLAVRRSHLLAALNIARVQLLIRHKKTAPIVVEHPGYGKPYPARTVLRDLASQEHNDGEPYDTMCLVADELERRGL